MTVLPTSPVRSHVSHNPWTNSSHISSTSTSSHTAHDKTAHSFLTDMSFGPQSLIPQTASSNSNLHHNLRAHTSATSPIKSVRKSSGSCGNPIKTGLERRGSTGTGISSTQTSHRSMHLSLSSSSVCSCLTEDVTLPHTEAIPPEQLGIAGEWIKVSFKISNYYDYFENVKFNCPHNKKRSEVQTIVMLTFSGFWS